LAPAVSVLRTLRKKAEQLFTSGFFSRIGSGIGVNIEAIYQSDPTAQAFLREVRGMIFHLSKSQGNVGTPSDEDMRRIEGQIADPTDFIPDDIRTVRKVFDDIERIMVSKLGAEHRAILYQQLEQRGSSLANQISPASDEEMQRFFEESKNAAN
jgi:hypothetical protein